MMDRKRTRRALSCTTCRKLKTRCDYNALHKKCHRCHVLRLECSLTSDKAVEDLADSETTEINVLDHRIKRIEDTLTELKDMISASSRSSFNGSTSGVSSSGYGRLELDSRNKNAMMTVIRNIDYKLFSRNSSYDHMEEASKPLSAWIKQRPEFCHQMAVIFMQKCSMYVIRRSVGVCSPLLLGVMTLQGMRLDAKSTHDELQRELFTVVRGVLTLALMTTPLRHDDIEALMYISYFNVARKPLQPIYDSWLLTGNAIKLYIMSVSFADMVDRAKSPLKHTAEHDLYLFRLWNSLCHCHLQYCIACGRPVMVPLDYLSECRKIVLLEASRPSDSIVVSEIELLGELAGVNSSKDGQKPLRDAIDTWYYNALPLFPLDQCKSLVISYYYALLLLETGVLDTHEDDQPRDPQIKRESLGAFETTQTSSGVGSASSASLTVSGCLSEPAGSTGSSTGSSIGTATGTSTSAATGTFMSAMGATGSSRDSSKDSSLGGSMSIIDHCKCIISIFLEIPPNLIEAMPNYPLCILVYSCITLCDATKDRKVETLALMSKIYWYISHIGLKNRDITHSIAEIIKSVIESRKDIKLDLFGAYPGVERHEQFQNQPGARKMSPQEAEYTYMRGQPQEQQRGYPQSSNTYQGALESQYGNQYSQHLPPQQERIQAPHSSGMATTGHEGYLSDMDKKEVKAMKAVPGYGLDYSEPSFQMLDISKYSSYDDFLEKMYSLV